MQSSSYNSVSTDIRILVSAASAVAIQLLPSASYSYPVLVKDISGAADTNPITVTFTGQSADGLTSVTINNPYGWFWFNPLTNGGGFYET